MNIPISKNAALVQGRSDERDSVGLANAMRALTNQQVNVWPDIITTTDATLTAIWSDTMVPNSVADLWAAVVGQVDGTIVGGFRRRAVLACSAAGVVRYVGGGQDIIGADKADDPTWAVAFALDATTPSTVYLSVTGAASTTVNWRANITGVVYPWTT